MTLIYALLAGLAVSAVSLIGLLTFFSGKDLHRRTSHLLLALAAGAMLGNAVLHLLPHAITLEQEWMSGRAHVHVHHNHGAGAPVAAPPKAVDHDEEHDHDAVGHKHDHDHDAAGHKHDHDHDAAGHKHDHDHDAVGHKHDHDHDAVGQKHDHDHDAAGHKHDHDHDAVGQKHDHDHDAAGHKHDHDHDAVGHKHDHDHDAAAAAEHDKHHGHGHTGLVTAFLLLGGFLVFYAADIFMRQRASAHGERTEGYLVWLSDSAENILDGIVIGTAFLISVPVGIAATLTIFLHEIPIELGDYAVMRHAGFSKRKALTANFLSGLLSLVGIVAAYFIGSMVGSFVFFATAFAAGAFLYIALCILVPHLRQEGQDGGGIQYFLVSLIGVALMAAILLIE